MNSAKVAPTTKSASAASAIGSAIDLADFSEACLSDLGTLFRAIREGSDKYSAAYEIAGIGQYLADEWIGSLDRSRADIRSMEDHFKDEAA